MCSRGARFETARRCNFATNSGSGLRGEGDSNRLAPIGQGSSPMRRNNRVNRGSERIGSYSGSRIHHAAKLVVDADIGPQRGLKPVAQSCSPRSTFRRVRRRASHVRRRWRRSMGREEEEAGEARWGNLEQRSKLRWREAMDQTEQVRAVRPLLIFIATPSRRGFHLSPHTSRLPRTATS